jgi:hypothetical protein
MTCDHGFFVLALVGVALLLVHEETEEAVGEDGPRVYQLGSSCRFTMDMVCCSEGLGYSDAGVRQGEFVLCCIAARPKHRSSR